MVDAITAVSHILVLQLLMHLQHLLESAWLVAAAQRLNETASSMHMHGVGIVKDNEHGQNLQ